MKYHGQRTLVGYSPWGSQRVRQDWATNTLSGLWLLTNFPTIQQLKTISICYLGFCGSEILVRLSQMVLAQAVSSGYREESARAALSECLTEAGWSASKRAHAVSAGVLTTWQLAPPSLQESDLGREEAKSHTSTMPSSSGEYYQTQPTLMERRRRLHCSKRRKIKEFVGLFFF